MDPLTLTILITSIIASLGGTAATIYGQNKANKTNIQLAREGQEFEREQVENMNVYNSPLNQMQRMSQAGLNPRMMYGTSGNGGLQTNTPTARVATVENSLKDAMKTDPLGTLQKFNNIRLTDAKIISETSRGTKLDSESYIRNLERQIKSHSFSDEKNATIQKFKAAAKKYPEEYNRIKQASERGQIDIDAYKSIVESTKLSKEMQTIAKLLMQVIKIK